MKEFAVSVVVLLFVPYLCLAKGLEKEYSKIIKKYDIDPSAIYAASRSDFWLQTRNKNERYAVFVKSCKNKSSTIDKAHQELKKLSSQEMSYLSSARPVNSINFLRDTLLVDLCPLGVYSDAMIYFIDTGVYNAYANPDGDIFIEVSILDEEEFSYPMLLGVCAHEFAHFLLQHYLAHAYNVKKKERKEKMIAGFTTAMYATSNVLAAYGGAKPANVDYDALFADGQKNAMLFAYKFSREQEIEADIIAYRFLEYIGYGGEYYIQALELLRKTTLDYSVYYSDTDDHPSISYRIDLLKYMQEHPEIVRKAGSPAQSCGLKFQEQEKISTFAI